MNVLWENLWKEGLRYAMEPMALVNMKRSSKREFIEHKENL